MRYLIATLILLFVVLATGNYLFIKRHFGSFAGFVDATYDVARAWNATEDERTRIGMEILRREDVRKNR